CMVSVTVVNEREDRRALQLSVYQHVDRRRGRAIAVRGDVSGDVFISGTSGYSASLATADISRSILVIVTHSSCWQGTVRRKNGAGVSVGPTARCGGGRAVAGVGSQRSQDYYGCGDQHCQDTYEVEFHCEFSFLDF